MRGVVITANRASSSVYITSALLTYCLGTGACPPAFLYNISCLITSLYLTTHTAHPLRCTHAHHTRTTHTRTTHTHYTRSPHTRCTTTTPAHYTHLLPLPPHTFPLPCCCTSGSTHTFVAHAHSLYTAVRCWRKPRIMTTFYLVTTMTDLPDVVSEHLRWRRAPGVKHAHLRVRLPHVLTPPHPCFHDASTCQARPRSWHMAWFAVP